MCVIIKILITLLIHEKKEGKVGKKLGQLGKTLGTNDNVKQVHYYISNDKLY